MSHHGKTLPGNPIQVFQEQPSLECGTAARKWLTAVNPAEPQMRRLAEPERWFARLLPVWGPGNSELQREMAVQSMGFLLAPGIPLRDLKYGVLFGRWFVEVLSWVHQDSELGVPGKPAACNYGLLSMNTWLL